MMYETIDLYFKNLFKLPKCTKKDEWEKVFNDMAVHTRKRKPTELLLARRPNEDDNVLAYRVNNFEPITYGSMNKALDDLHRIVCGISYSLDVPDNVREYLDSYVIAQYANELHSEIITPRVFIEKNTLRQDIDDPNGFLIWFPGGAGVKDSSQKVSAEPKLVLCSQYVYSDDFVFIYLAEEKTPLKDDDGKMVNEGDLFYFITKQEIWKMYQVGKKSDPKWKQEVVYKHNLGAFPIIVLGGDKNSEGFYESYFAPYLAFGNEAIRQYSDWQAIMVNSSFPIKEMFGTECQIERVEKDSNVPNDQEENYKGGGNGNYELKIMQPGPHGVIKRRVPLPNMNDDALPVEIPAIRYINPDIEVAKYSGEVWVQLIERAEQALNIDMTLGMDQSGAAKQIDKESQYSMITKIGNNFFDNIYLNSLKIIDGYLNRVTFEKSQCNINKPKTFWVKTEQELTQEIGQLKTSNAPGFFLAEATVDLAKKRFSGNPVKEKMFKFISLYDPVFTSTLAEKNMMLSSLTLSKEDYIRSVRMPSILNQMVEEMSPDKFIQTDFAKLLDEFQKMVEQYFPEEVSLETDDNGNIK